MRLGASLPQSAAVVVCFCVFASALNFRYHKHEEMTQFLKELTKEYSKLARLNSIGYSIWGNELWTVEVSAVNDSVLTVPNVKLIATIHGNEAVGREMLLHFLEFLVTSYEKNSKIKWLLDNTRIHILPSMNPDGFHIAEEGTCSTGNGRGNAKNIDLNRSFPDFFKKNHKMQESSAIPESVAMQKWMREVPFILSASLHGGALVANYPYESVHSDDSLPPGMPFPSPDDDVFQFLARTYAERHPKMHYGYACYNKTVMFEGGITNGAAWYRITGGMQDYNYIAHGCMEVTLEISCCKYPPATDLANYWDENKFALLDYVTQAHRGVKGIIRDGITKEAIHNATLRIVERDMPFYSSKRGEYWRILLPGTYELEVSAKGYHKRKVSFVVTLNPGFPNATILNVSLYPLYYQTTTALPTTSTDGSSGRVSLVSSDTEKTSQTSTIEIIKSAEEDEYPFAAEVVVDGTGSSATKVFISYCILISCSLIISVL